MRPESELSAEAGARDVGWAAATAADEAVAGADPDAAGGER